MAGEIRIIRKDTGSRKYLVELGFIGSPEKCHSLAEEGDLGFRDLMAAKAYAVELQEVIGLPINFYQEKETRTITHEPLPQHWLTMTDGDYVDSKGNRFTLKGTTWINTHGMVAGEPPYEELKPYMNPPAPGPGVGVWEPGWYRDINGQYFEKRADGAWYNLAGIKQGIVPNSMSPCPCPIPPTPGEYYPAVPTIWVPGWYRDDLLNCYRYTGDGIWYDSENVEIDKPECFLVYLGKEPADTVGLQPPILYLNGWYEDRVSGNHFYHEKGIWFNRDLELIPEVKTMSQLRFTGLTQKDVKPV